MIVLTDAGRLFDSRQQVWIVPVSNRQSGQPGGGCQLVIVCALLKIEIVNRIGPREGLVILECTAGSKVNVAGIITGSKSFHKAASKRSRVEPALCGER